MAIEGKIAHIIDEQNIVINRGETDGVSNGMVFAVVAPVDVVKDPDTGEELGKWEAVKGYIQARHVQERMTVCGPAKRGGTEPENDDASTHTLSREMVEVSMPQKKQKALSVDRMQAAGMPAITPIRVGDMVRSV